MSQTIRHIHDHGDLKSIELLIKINEIIDFVNKLAESQPQVDGKD